MRRLLSASALTAVTLLASSALPCGAGFGQGYAIEPAQQIVVAQRDGQETYIFNPRFCGNADTFGLILPVPSTLSKNPSLAGKSLYDSLAKITAPEIVTQERCRDGGTGGSSGWNGGAHPGTGGGAQVIERGQVGIFDWALLRATDVEAFTAWLDQNNFPHASSADSAFEYYVTRSWYFVAFKVTASATGGGGGAGGAGSGASRLCGNFGPVALSFASEHAVVPARIAAVSSASLSWDIFAVGPERLALGPSATLRFAGDLLASDLALPGMSEIARAGDQLTETLVYQSTSDDLEFAEKPDLADYRRTEYRYEWVDCAGVGGISGSTGTNGGSSNGGSFNAGSSNGGNGGSLVGGSVNGGSSNGGSFVGGSSNGGSSNGGSSVGGSASGGSVNGGSSNGVSSNGGSSKGGSPGAEDDSGLGCSYLIGSRGHMNGSLFALIALSAGIWARRRRTRAR